MNPHDHRDLDITPLAARVALAPVLEALGVVGVKTEGATRTWRFKDDAAVPIHERRHQHAALDPVQALARALALAIRDVDGDDDRARVVRLALAEVLDAARERVGDEWETIVFHEVGRLLDEAGIAAASITVEADRVLVEPVEVVEPDLDDQVRLEDEWGDLLS